MKRLFSALVAGFGSLIPISGQEALPTYEAYLRDAVATTEEIDVFLNERSWAQFDEDVGYILGNYFPRDGWNGSRTISTTQTNGARTS